MVSFSAFRLFASSQLCTLDSWDAESDVRPLPPLSSYDRSLGSATVGRFFSFLSTDLTTIGCSSSRPFKRWVYLLNIYILRWWADCTRIDRIEAYFSSWTFGIWADVRVAVWFRAASTRSSEYRLGTQAMHAWTAASCRCIWSGLEVEKQRKGANKKQKTIYIV